ncbi:hypothetical protein C8T65DRAFT_691617 [Cerioporus squamosus]|nr:hypothetical protein C8T65DRAFT_691617 [Cerioporus squamosus]
MTKSKSQNFFRCNQCKLVFRTLPECKEHAEHTGHVYKPAYFCSHCSQSFSKCKKRAEHIQTTGHIQQTPANIATVSAATAPSTSTGSAPPHSAQAGAQHALSEDLHSVALFKNSGALFDHKKRCPTLEVKPPITALPGVPGALDGRATAASNSIPRRSVSTTSAKEQPYFCNSCYQVVDSALLTVVHTRATGHESFTPLIAEVACPDCPHKFKTVAGCENRRLTNSCSAQKECPLAPRLRHVRAGTSAAPSTSLGEEEQPYFCNKCFQIVNSSPLTAAHTRATGHKSFTPLVAEVICPDCPQKFKTVAGYENPFPSQAAAVHAMEDSEAEAGAAITTEETRCAKCSIGFSSMETLQAHYDESPLHPTCHTWSRLRFYRSLGFAQSEMSPSGVDGGDN